MIPATSYMYILYAIYDVIFIVYLIFRKHLSCCAMQIKMVGLIHSIGSFLALGP